MKFNSQICTTKEQSERLLALGLKKEGSDMSDRTLYECSKCGKWESAMFTVYADKKVNFCPFCGSDQYLCQIKSGKRGEENKKK